MTDTPKLIKSLMKDILEKLDKFSSNPTDETYEALYESLDNIAFSADVIMGFVKEKLH